jgi:hypothetical protein
MDAILRWPDGSDILDGAVVELHRDADGVVVADVRIPARQDEPA